MNYATAAQADLFQLRRHAEDIQRLSDPFPAMVTLADFVKRDLNRAIAAGDCSVYRKKPPFGHDWLPVICIERPSPLRDHYVIHAAEGFVRDTWNGLDELKVEWHLPDWRRLSVPMRRALHYFAVEPSARRWGFPHGNTLKALTKRGLVMNGQPTAMALHLHRLHRKEFEDA